MCDVSGGLSLSHTSYLGLLDRTRMFLCLFVLTLFLFNPFAGIVKLGQGGEFPAGGRVAGRTLLTADDSEHGESCRCNTHTPVIALKACRCNNNNIIIIIINRLV